MQPKRRILLIILDGFGINANTEFNAIANAKIPNWEYLTKTYAFGTLEASSNAVGLPKKQFGNSEVGHLNIGAGRVIEQYIVQIDTAIENGSFFTNPVFNTCLNTTKSRVIHILGLLSDGGVHSHINHIFALIKLAQTSQNITKIWVHAFLDGRDTPPQSANKYLNNLQEFLLSHPKAQIGTISGRYYAMDRDQRYDRIKLSYDAIINGISQLNGSDALQILSDEYKNGRNDEFVIPHVMLGYKGIHDDDSIIFANFRSDRAIELTDAIINHDFNAFKRSNIKLSNFVSMTSYDPKFKLKIAFSQKHIKNTLGEYISSIGLRQLRIAETEKYPHVTFFFNGGEKMPFPNEERILIDSPKDVATYDLKPEMSLPEVTNELLKAIDSKKYDFIITNFANGDMVGHTGSLPAAIKAVEAIDLSLGLVINKMRETGGEVLVIADHGNCEEMFDYKANQPHTQHTTNLVPCLYIGRNAKIKLGGALKDVSPTLLFMSGIDQPPEMTGHNLIELIEDN